MHSVKNVHAKTRYFWRTVRFKAQTSLPKSLHRTAADHLRSGRSDTLKSKQECNCQSIQSIPNPPKFLTKCLKPKWSFTKLKQNAPLFSLLYNPSSVALWLWFCLVKFSWNAETVKLDTLVWCQRMPSICHFCTSTLYYRSWWLNQPIWKICSSNWIISPGVKIKKKWNHHPVYDTLDL